MLFYSKGKLKEFNGKVDPRLQVTEPELLSFIHSSDPNSSVKGIPHLETFLRWPSGDLSLKIHTGKKVP